MILAISNQKGGTGKTATTLTLAAGLCDKGYNVLIIDMDGQCNLTDDIITEHSKSIVNLLAGEKADAVIFQSPIFGDIIPGDKLMHNPAPILTKMDSLLKVLKPLSKGYSYILLDTPPNMGRTMVSVLYAADAVLIPAIADKHSANGIGEMLQTIADMKRHNKRLAPLGIVVNMFEGRRNLHKQYYEVIKSCCEDNNMFLFPPIRKSMVVPESFSMRSSVFQYAPNHKVTDDYRAFTNAFIKSTERMIQK